MLRSKIEECTQKIQELGSMPQPDMVNKYMAYTSKNVRSHNLFDCSFLRKIVQELNIFYFVKQLFLIVNEIVKHGAIFKIIVSVDVVK